jgi:hypothetical protein
VSLLEANELQHAGALQRGTIEYTCIVLYITYLYNCARRVNCAALRWGVCEWRNIRTKCAANSEIGSEVELGGGVKWGEGESGGDEGVTH